MALMAVALADGKITDEEQMAIAEVCQGWGIKMKDLNYYKNHPERVKHSLPQKTEDKVSTLAGLMTVMAADGEINPREMEICKKFAIACGLDPSVVDNTVRAIQNKEI